MNMKKYVSIIATLATLGSLALAIPAFAQQAPGGQRGFGRMNGGQAPAVVGTVSAISGTTLTVTSKATLNGGTTTTYTVDASNATVTKSGQASSVSGIAIGDTVMIQGTVSGSSVTATTIRDGQLGMRGMPGQNPGIFGTVSAISGNSLTVTGKQGYGSTTATTTYTVDATNATVTKNNAASTVSAIAVGDTLMIQGTVSGTSVTATTIRDGVMPGGTRPNGNGTAQPAIQGNGQPVVAGSITAINGNSITITNKSNVTYTVDATNAKFVVKGIASPTISNLAVGDNLVIQGTVNGTSVTASSIIDQKAPANSNTTNSGSGQPSSPGIFGGIGHMFGGIGNFFKHMFGF